MRLSPDEELFLRHWMYEEAHYRAGPGPAKRLQLLHRARPADLALLIAAAFPDLAEQEAAGVGPPPSQSPAWPWSEEGLPARLREARTTLARRSPEDAPGPAAR
jgi:hypothetical protein